MIEFLYQALDAEKGIKVASEDAKLLRQKLYALRSQDPLFACLHFILSPTNPNGELWIVKANAEGKDAESDP